MATASEHITHTERAGRGHTLENIGRNIVRYGLVVILLWAGALKFTADEAEAVRLWVMNSPLLSWGHSMMSVRDFAASIGAIEVSLALLVAARPVAPKASAAGSLGAVAMFLIGLSFALTTQGLWQPGYGFPVPSPETGQLLASDIMLLGAAVWTAGEALLAFRLKDTGVTVTCLMPGATETEFFERAGMMDTKVGTQEKDDPADVARVGFDAMMRGDGDVVSGWKNKLQTAVAGVTPAGVLAEQHRKMAEPGTAKK